MMVIHCWHCGGDGHIVYFKDWQNHDKGTEDLRCGYCGGSGHMILSDENYKGLFGVSA